MVCTVSAGTAASYYVGSQAQYFLGAGEPFGRWYMPVPIFQLTDGERIDAQIFERIHHGQSPDGMPLRQSSDPLAPGVGGYDLTFSAPKSVSIAWALASVTTGGVIERAHDAAIRDALTLLNQHAAFTRRGQAGHLQEPIRLSGAIFQHGESRPVEREDGGLEADPQLHSHVVIFNAAQRADGSWGSVDGRHFFRWKMALGAVYRQSLARRLAEHGFPISVDRESGFFEIESVPDVLRDLFSSRRKQIVTEIQKEGAETRSAAALAAAITRSTRKAKVASPDESRHHRWRQRATEAGVTEGALKGMDPHRNLGPLLEDTLGRDMVGQLLARLTEHESTFQRQDVFRGAAALLTGDLRQAAVESLVEQTLSDPRVMLLQSDKGGLPNWTTLEMLEIERGIAAMSKRAMERRFRSAAMSPEGSSADTPLNSEQSAAVKALTDHRSLVILEGKAGTGKTTALREVSRRYEALGLRTIGCATAWRTALQLGKECRIEARATDAWLASPQFLDRRSVLLVDEAGQLSSRQMHNLLSAADDAGAKIILCGDRRQLLSVGAGPGLKLVADEIGVQPLDSILRQTTPWLRDAVIAMSCGQAATAIDALAAHDGLVWRQSPDDAMAAIVNSWAALGNRVPNESALVIARSNAEVRRLNKLMREQLRAIGRLGHEQVQVQSGGGRSTDSGIALSVGDQIRFGQRVRRLGVVNGSVGEITALKSESDGHAQIVVRFGGGLVSLSTRELINKRGECKLSHAYASTVFSAQGMTADHVLILGSSGFRSNDAYVALSRARSSAAVFLSRHAIDASVRALTPAADRHELRLKDAQRLGALAAWWGRGQVKRSALDLIANKSADMQLTKSRERSLELD